MIGSRQPTPTSVRLRRRNDTSASTEKNGDTIRAKCEIDGESCNELHSIHDDDNDDDENDEDDEDEDEDDDDDDDDDDDGDDDDDDDDDCDHDDG